MEEVSRPTETYNGLPLYVPEVHGEYIASAGNAYVRRPHPVFMVCMDHAFAVQTDSGVVMGQKGDWLCHDPVSGHVWPVKNSYKQSHYVHRDK